MQVLHSPLDSRRGKLLSQYTLARINSMKGIDLALFDFDRHNALYYFALNSNEEIYFRYGGRDDEAADTYLNLESLELALEQGLKMHEVAKNSSVSKGMDLTPKFPDQIPGLNEYVVKRDRCVECHHIAHFETTYAEKNNTLDKLSDMFRSPNIKNLGIFLDIPKGLRVKAVSGAAQSAGLKVGDIIIQINSQAISTFGDFQYYLDKADRTAKKINLTIYRDQVAQEITLLLPQYWWKTDISYRNWTIEPLIFFESKKLTNLEKEALGLPVDGIASLVTDVPIDAVVESAHELKVGDIITAVEGEERNALGTGIQLHIKIFHRSGDSLELTVMREGKLLKLPLHTKRKVFRRVED